MNPLNILTSAIFGLLLIFSIVLIVLLVKCWLNRSQIDMRWLNENKQNSDEEIEKNKSKVEERIKAQLNNPEEIMISDEIPYYLDQKCSERKIILKEHNVQELKDNQYDYGKSITNNKKVILCHETVTNYEKQQQNLHPPHQQLEKLTATVIIIEHPEIDNFNQTLTVEPKIVFYDDKLEQSCYY